MEERRTAAWILGIIGLITVFFTMVLPEIKFRSTQTISFRSCTVKFNYRGPGLASDVYRASQNKLALCLCDVYKKRTDTSIANRIFQIYHQYGNHYNYDTLRLDNNIDSIIMHKNIVLDTLVLID